ncbi:hypothetical protein C2W64_02781 [Brevibacillus laterosporus]|nr:hypothetical protein [Brevibacillus laterosporus]RAP24774.1 hypothetical protein C2W64_02781 [Brevibacillus laterosporus]
MTTISSRGKVLLIGASILNFLAIIWFALGSTANFNRGVDLVTTVIMIVIGVPAIILFAISLLIFFAKGGDLNGWKKFFAPYLITSMCFTSLILFLNVNTNGWLTENVRSDLQQRTTDNRYEYCIELVNIFQKNSSARLYLKNIQTSEEIRIPLNLPTNEIQGLSTKKYFIYLGTTANTNIYKLVTTKQSPFPNFEFEINIQDRTAIELH